MGEQEGTVEVWRGTVDWVEVTTSAGKRGQTQVAGKRAIRSTGLQVAG